ncbi:Gfo/Idh/MocA family oxidoreductase [Lichenihabitans sp. Uapishka_5]|uniref:Gfo/Idh/MocA family protein n=1 Tax=Lichenihabitans sp. Uapishka_5 TaxID=3037302 RepID=UPI0029E7ED7C|nr:Gfo/Idh/MocA family oxidoreductase [Lichenihabitans sp. Uapishka_5]MDX7949735.1 Gfo/Idh/MocA family oxidoreductase [Lichenihabitans sp. Uapishka_5]
MARPIGWGIAGFGWVAADYMAPAIAAAGDRLVAVADPSPRAQAAAKARGVPSYASVAELAADAAVEAIYVATPNHLHRVAVEAAAAAGKAVLCEKPIAATLADAEAAVAACRKAGVLYGTAFDQRHHPAHKALRQAVADGAIGSVTAVRILYACWLGPDWSSGHDGGHNWRADAGQAGGGALMDLAPHGLDLVEFLLGEPVAQVAAMLQRRIHAYPVDDGAMLIGGTRLGVLVNLHVAYNCPDALPRRRLEVAGSAGLLVAENTMGQDAGGSLTRIDGATGRHDAMVVADADASPFLGQVQAFGDALRSGRWDAFSGARDLDTMRLLAQAYRNEVKI